MTLMAIFGGLSAAMQGTQIGMGAAKGQIPPLSQAMPVGGRPLIQMGNPYQMMYQNQQPQDPNMMSPGLSSALKRYGGMYG